MAAEVQRRHAPSRTTASSSGLSTAGIWPENASFAAPPTSPAKLRSTGKWHGVCQAGVEAADACNNKLIGARYYDTGPATPSPEFDSPRVTSTGTAPTPRAPRAATTASRHRSAASARQRQWHGPGRPHRRLQGPVGDGHSPAHRRTDDIVAAIDDAVADGVDVINYSISGSQPCVVDPGRVAFIGAADAGVFVAASAGNAGPWPAGRPQLPVATTVAAGTHDRGSTSRHAGQRRDLHRPRLSARPCRPADPLDRRRPTAPTHRPTVLL